MSLSPAASAGAQTVVDTSWTALTKNLGDVALEGSFTLTDAAITANSLVMIIQTAPTAAGREDEAQMDPLSVMAFPGTGLATVYWTTLGQGPVKGSVRFLYTVG